VIDEAVIAFVSYFLHSLRFFACVELEPGIKAHLRRSNCYFFNLSATSEANKYSMLDFVVDVLFLFL